MDRTLLAFKILMHDNDGKYSKPFLAALKKRKIKPHKTAIRSPNTISFGERFVQTLKQECLDHFIVFGHMLMDVLCREFKDLYLEERPHQCLDNDLIAGPKIEKKRQSKSKSVATRPIKLSDVHCKEGLGGGYYTRKISSVTGARAEHWFWQIPRVALSEFSFRRYRISNCSPSFAITFETPSPLRWSLRR